MPIVRLQPQGVELEAPRKANLLRFLQDKDVPVGSACGGKGLCASCKVTVLEGRRNLSQPNDQEIDLAHRNSLAKTERISCQSKNLGEIEITTSYWDKEL